MKERAATTVESTAQIINSCLNSEMSQAAQGALPNESSLKKTVRRKRNEVNSAPPAPTRLEDLVIPEMYKTFQVHGIEENFLIADSGPETNRILLFGRERNVHEILRDSEHWFVDGTFSTAPQLFYQIYVIMAKKFGAVHPVIYALLPNKQTNTYMRMIALLKEVEPNLNPRKISCDYELAAINAFQEAFPACEILGCFFHLVKNMRKHLGNLQLLGRYNNDADFALYARMVTSLAFVPIHDLDTAVDELATEIPLELQPLLQWFEDSYLGRPNRRGNGRNRPIFPPETWSVYTRVLTDTDRTNNHAEAAHRRLQSELSMDRPTIWKLIYSLKQIQRGRDVFFEQLAAGAEPPRKKKKYIDSDNRIKCIVMDYENRSVIEYLRGISHNYVM